MTPAKSIIDDKILYKFYTILLGKSILLTFNFFSIRLLDMEVLVGNKHGRKLETVHHIVPRSRGGGDDKNTVKWPAHFHVLWHSLFENLLLEEVVEMITIMSQPGEKWTSAEVRRLKRDIQSRRGF